MYDLGRAYQVLAVEHQMYAQCLIDGKDLVALKIEPVMREGDVVVLFGLGIGQRLENDVDFFIQQQAGLLKLRRRLICPLLQLIRDILQSLLDLRRQLAAESG